MECQSIGRGNERRGSHYRSCHFSGKQSDRSYRNYHRRGQLASIAFHELPQDLGLAFVGNLPAMMAATVARLMRLHGQQRLRTGEAVPQKQRRDQ